MKYTIQVLNPHSASQEQIVRAFITPKLKEVWVACGTKYGKALANTTLIPTVKGWKTMGLIREGDQVFGPDGEPTTVTFVTETMHDRKCYEVVFSDGQTIVCDADHLWATSSVYERKHEKHTVRTTEEIKNTISVRRREKLIRNHSIPCLSNPLKFPKKNLKINPYLLASWLCNGDKRHAHINLNHSRTHVTRKIREMGLEIYSYYTSDVHFLVKGLYEDLEELKLLNNKHVPDDYLNASPEQRLMLIRGFMDNAGRCSNSGNMSFETRNLGIYEAFSLLLMGMGIKVSRSKSKSKKGITTYRVGFTTDHDVFTDPRWLERIHQSSDRNKRRFIVEVKETASVPVRCLKVDREDSLFVAGEGCIVTHNTIAAVNSLIVAAPLQRDAVFRWVAPIYAQSMISYRYARRFIPNSPHITFNKSDPSIVFDPLNTRWEFRTGKDPEALEGEATAGNVLDECSKMSQEVYASVRTTTTVTRGPIMGISTPRGKNWFYNRCMAAKEEMEWAIQRGKDPHRIFLTAPTTDNPHVSIDVVNDAQRTLPRRLFRQYYLAEFVDDGGTFSNFKACFYTERLQLEMGLERWFDPNMRKTADGLYDHAIIIGADWAKKVDYTVFTAWDYKTRKLVGFWRFQGANYIDAVKKVYQFGNHFRYVELLMHDQTGIGEVIDDLLDKTGFPYQGVSFTNRNKNFMVNNLIIAFEQRDIQIPYWPEMVTELDSYEVQTNQVGTMKFAAASGYHDDIVSSMILGWAAVSDYSSSELSVKIIEELKNPSETVDWLSDYEDDDDREVIPWEQAILRP